MRTLPLTLYSSFIAAGVILASVGCRNTAGSRQAATSLATRMSAYRDAQEKRVAGLNTEYRDTFARLMDTLEDLSEAELQQARDGDAQRSADTLIADSKASLRGQFRQSFANLVQQQRQQIAQADLAIATVRENYAKSYQDAKLELAKVNTIITNLEAMAKDPTDVQQVEEAIRVIGIFTDAYEKARAKAATQAATDSKK